MQIRIKNPRHHLNTKESNYGSSQLSLGSAASLWNVKANRTSEIKKGIDCDRYCHHYYSYWDPLLWYRFQILPELLLAFNWER